MKLSQNGINFIKQNEGFSANPYKDIGGRVTVGIGHLILPTDTFTYPLTEEQAENILLNDASHVEVFLNAACPGLFQNEFDALVDFGFNLGCNALHQMLAHGLDQLPVQILRWDHDAGKVVQGLLDRRQRELDMWNLDSALRGE